MSRPQLLALLLFGALYGPTAPGSSRAAVPPDATPPLLVYCAAGIRNPIEAAARSFGEREGIEVEVTYAGSGCLLAQAEIAGRGDVYLPGEEHYAAQAKERGSGGELVRLAHLQPVIAVAKGNPHSIRGLEDLTRPGLRIGLGDSTAIAVGIAAERWIRGSLSPTSQEELHDRVRTRALNVNELGTQLTLGALDAAIVWDATVPLFPGLEAVAPPEASSFRTVVCGCVLSTSKQRERAGRFLEYLASAEGAALFERFGYRAYTPLVASP